MNWKLYHVTTPAGKYLALGLTEEVVRENVGALAEMNEATSGSITAMRLAGESERVIICV